MRKQVLWVGAVGLALLAAGCGSAGDTGGSGWIGGEPAWESGDGADGGAMAESAVAAPGAAADRAGGEAAIAPAPALEGLRAGSVDDNADYAGFLEYLDRIGDAAVSTRDFDATGRVLVQVLGSDGLPLAGEVVEVRVGDDVVATVRTTANGSVRFWPGLYGQAEAERFDLAVAGETASAAPGEEVTITADRAGGRQDQVAVDVMFLLDATGSMGDEIDRLTQTVDSVAGRVAELEGSPDARFGMTLYRDEGDAFVTSTFDLTGDLAAFRSALADVRADGGGDYPEAMDEGLAAALGEPGWRDPATTVQLVFLVADAPPQVGRQVEQPYPASVVEAVGRGLKIFPIASSESDDRAEAVFRQVAAGTGSRFVFLSYGAAGAATGESSDITRTDYEELSLDDLVVRLVAEELAALSGGEPAPQPTSSPSPSTPPDQ